jgi:hypothetical protein
MKKEREYIVPCRITRRTEVVVIATCEEDARVKFHEGDWEAEDARDLGELLDWTIDGALKENK